MNIIAKYIHGSADSTDVDVYYVVDDIPPFQEAKAFCDAIKDENANLITIKNGEVNRCYKGTIDECNNSLYDTYHLHSQTSELLVTHRVHRDVYLKSIRAVRIILSHLSRSEYRPIVKEALKSKSFTQKINTLMSLDIGKIDFNSLSHNINGSDVLKVIAFQLGQINGLLHGKELYTKSDIAEMYPILRPALYRSDNVDLYDIRHFMCQTLSLIHGYVYYEDSDNGFVTFRTNETYDVNLELKIN